MTGPYSSQEKKLGVGPLNQAERSYLEAEKETRRPVEWSAPSGAMGKEYRERPHRDI